MDKVRAATFAYTSTAFPMLTGTLVTAAGFVPVGFARSAAGEYTFSMFAVVTMALLTSWVVAVVFAPLIGVAVLSQKMPHRSVQPGAILGRFRQLLVRAMRARRTTIGVTVALLLLAVLALRLVPQQFFPASDRPELLVDLTLSRSASIYASDRVTTRFEKLLPGDPDIDHWSSYVGQGAVRFYLPLNVQLPNDFFSQVVIVTKSLAARERVRARLSRVLSEQFPEVVARLSPLELGPPVGWPLQYRISGPDPEKVSELAYQAAAVVASDGRTQSINFNWIEPMRTLRIRVNQDEARLLGVSSQTLAQSLNAVVSGINITQIRDDIYLIDVIARAGADERLSPATLKTLAIPLPNGKSVPLLQLASIEYGLDWPLVWRRDRLATITVSADLVGAVLPATVIRSLEHKMTALEASFPAGYRVQVGGTAEESAKSLRSVAAGLPLAALIMLIVLMVQLQSVSRLFLVLSVAPFGLIGVVLALLIAGKPMGFVAILGIIALVGMIVRNSVILVHQIETEIQQRTQSLGGGDRGHRAPFPADPAHRGRGNIRHDPHRADGFLGADGAGNHGRPCGRDRPDAGVPAGPLRRLVWHPRGRANSGPQCRLKVYARRIFAAQIDGALVLLMLAPPGGLLVASRLPEFPGARSAPSWFRRARRRSSRRTYARVAYRLRSRLTGAGR